MSTPSETHWHVQALLLHQRLLSLSSCFEFVSDFSQSILCSSGSNRLCDRSSESGAAPRMRASGDVGCGFMGQVHAVHKPDGTFVCTVKLPLDCCVEHPLHSTGIFDGTSAEKLDVVSSPFISTVSRTLAQTAVCAGVAVASCIECALLSACMRLAF